MYRGKPHLLILISLLKFNSFSTWWRKKLIVKVSKRDGGSLTVNMSNFTVTFDTKISHWWQGGGSYWGLYLSLVTQKTDMDVSFQTSPVTCMPMKLCRKNELTLMAVRLWGFGWVELAFWLLSDIFVDNFWMYWKYGVYSVFQNNVLC